VNADHKFTIKILARQKCLVLKENQELDTEDFLDGHQKRDVRHRDLSLYTESQNFQHQDFLLTLKNSKQKTKNDIVKHFNFSLKRIEEVPIFLGRSLGSTRVIDSMRSLE
jgi:hypothetical protein